MYYFNLDFIYYLIYIFFRGIWNFFTFGANLENGGSDITILDLIRYFTNSNYSLSGEGIGAFSDGYSLFTPPNGFDSWGDTFSEALANWFNNFFSNPYCPTCPSFFDMIFGGINSLFWIGSILLIILFLFLKDKENRLKKLEWEKFEVVFEKEDGEKGNYKSEQWDKILALLDTENPNDWKMAILEADKLLDSTLIEHNYTGLDLGSRLKSADFETIQNAWEAHKVRNAIAHDPNYQLSKREAKRAIQNYSAVFNEFYYL